MATATAIDTAKAARRGLKFTCLGCVAADLDRIEAAHRAGTLGHSGNWSPGQILDHCAIILEIGLDGSNVDAGFFARIVGRLVKRFLLKPDSMRPGFKLPKRMSALAPRPGVTFDQGMVRIRRALARIDAGERMTKPSPFLGPMTHQEWVALNANHCQLHFGFLTL